MTILKIRWFEVIKRPEDSDVFKQSFKALLRYDTAFHNDDDFRTLGYVAFPVFSTKFGSFGGRITEAYWNSFGYVLRAVNSEAAKKFKRPRNMIPTLKTYRFPRDAKGKLRQDLELELVSITDFLDAKPSLGVFE